MNEEKVAEETSSTLTPTEVLSVPSIHRHSAAVKRLRWKTQCSSDTGNMQEIGTGEGQRERLLCRQLMFASCGDDHAVRVHKVVLGA